MLAMSDGNLDTISAGLIFALFEELVEKGKTIIMVTHDRDLAGKIPRWKRCVMANWSQRMRSTVVWWLERLRRQYEYLG